MMQYAVRNDRLYVQAQLWLTVLDMPLPAQ